MFRYSIFNAATYGRISVLLFVLLSGTAPVAYAEGGYFGVSFGQAQSSDVADAVEFAFQDVLGVTPSVDDKDSAWKIFGGYQSNPNLALEFSYVDLGDITGKALGVTETVESTGFAFSVVGILPVSETFKVFGKFGLFIWDADISATGPGGSASLGDSGNDLTYGFGLSFDVNKSVAIRAEYEIYELDDVDYNLVSAGLSFRF